MRSRACGRGSEQSGKRERSGEDRDAHESRGPFEKERRFARRDRRAASWRYA
jgi:hypothetical protein